VYGNLFSSSFINSTFTNVTCINYGGAIYIGVYNYSSFTINRCIFTVCEAEYGGAILLEFISYIHITNTRFENNKATYGDDIYVWEFSPCFNKILSGTLASSVCSTTPLGDRVSCNKSDKSQLLNTCPEDVV
jgi:hypothetical protein